jgi:hypothetical protein
LEILDIIGKIRTASFLRNFSGENASGEEFQEFRSHL